MISKVVHLIVAAFAMSLPHFVQTDVAYLLSLVFSLPIFLGLTRHVEKKIELFFVGLIYVICFIIKYHGYFNSGTLGYVFHFLIGTCSFIPFLIDKLAFRVRYSFISTFAFPFSWMSIYTFFYYMKIPGYMRLDYYLESVKGLIQIESIIGCAGFMFLICFLSSMLVYGILNKSFDSLLGFCSIMIVLTVFGSLRLTLPGEPDSTVKFAFCTGPYIGEASRHVDASYDKYLISFNKTAKEAHEKKAKLLVYTEKSFKIDHVDLSSFLETACSKAKAYNIHILVSYELYNRSNKNWNELTWIDNKGNIVATYDETMLLPNIEKNIESGKGDIPYISLNIDGQNVQISALICYDSNFSTHLSQMKKDTDILVLPSWDWKAVATPHMKLVNTVAVEQGVTVLKPTYDGFNTVTDPYGRVSHMSDTNETGYENVQIVDVPEFHVKKLYRLLASFILWIFPLGLIILFNSYRIYLVQVNDIRKIAKGKQYF